MTKKKKTPLRDFTAQIQRLEKKYDRIDTWAAKRKEIVASKISKLKREQHGFIKRKSNDA